MALTLTKVNSSGVSISYFRVSSVIVNRKVNSVCVRVDAYLDQPTRAAGNTPVSSKSYTAVDAPTNASFAAGAAVNEAYAYLKTLPDFVGAANS